MDALLQTFLNILIVKKTKKQKRNKIILKIISSNLLISCKKKGKRKSPRFWIPSGQSSPWWDNFCARQKDSEKWKENFCMSQETFQKLHTEPRPYIKQNQTRFWGLFSVEKQVVSVLCYFAHEGKMRKLGNSFGIGELKVWKIIRIVLFSL